MKKNFSIDLAGEYLWKIFVFFSTAFVIHYYFIDEIVIGGNKNYLWFIVIVPIATGVTLLGYYFYKSELERIYSEKNNKKSILATSVILFSCVLLAYIIFGFIPHAAWNYLNKKESEKNPTEILTFDHVTFSSGRRSQIKFTFNNKKEFFYARQSSVREYRKDPDKYILKLEVKKGIWDYYVVNNWYIENK